VTPDCQSLLTLLPARLWLRHASRNEFVVAGGEGGSFIDRLPPGGGLWQGERVQVVCAIPAERHERRPAESRISTRGPLAIVSTRVGIIRRHLEAQPGFTVVDVAAAGSDVHAFAESKPQSASTRLVILGDVDDWQSRWGALSALRPVAEILFDGCSPADFRVLTRSRELPPPLSPSNGLGTAPLVWRLEQDGTATRARLTPRLP
jgi:S-DNA-T family DNA segregation ATPase FtsK/SpoIIIE